MRNLLNFLARFNNLIIFLLLEVFALYLIVNRNNYHNAQVIKGIRGTTRLIEKQITSTFDYSRLNEINTELAAENADLRNRLERHIKSGLPAVVPGTDTLSVSQYDYVSAEIINNSVNRQKNFFTLDKGLKDSVDVDMAVICPSGVAGIVVARSENYSLAMSLLNIDFRLSSQIRSSGYFGSLTWDGRDKGYAVLNEIPQHISLNTGDTIETTSYSSIFPEGIIVGIISDFAKSGSDFYRINVKLAVDFRKLKYVTIIRNLRRTEQVTLENSTPDD